MLQYTIVDAKIMKKKKLTGKSQFHLITFAANCQIWNFYGHSGANIIKKHVFLHPICIRFNVIQQQMYV